MSPRKSTKSPSAPTTAKELQDTLWEAANKLRGSMDASTHKEVICGVVILKYVSDAFDERRDSMTDWTKRPEARAELRSSIKHLLCKYVYPPGCRRQDTSAIIHAAEAQIVPTFSRDDPR